MTTPGTVVIVNGVPRSRKTSLAAALQGLGPRPLLGLGVDVYAGMTPPRYRPGLGLRPGGERPDLEPLVATDRRPLPQAVILRRRAASGLLTIGPDGVVPEPVGR